MELSNIPTLQMLLSVAYVGESGSHGSEWKVAL